MYDGDTIYDSTGYRTGTENSEFFGDVSSRSKLSLQTQQVWTLTLPPNADLT